MSNEMGRNSVIAAMKVRTALKGDGSWLHRSQETSQELELEGKPRKPNILVKPHSLLPTKVISDNSIVILEPSLQSNVTSSSPIKPATSSPVNPSSSRPIKPPTSTGKGQALDSSLPEGDPSLPEKKVVEVKRSDTLVAGRQHSYVLSAVKKFESGDSLETSPIKNNLGDNALGQLSKVKPGKLSDLKKPLEEAIHETTFKSADVPSKPQAVEPVKLIKEPDNAPVQEPEKEPASKILDEQTGEHPTESKNKDAFVSAFLSASEDPNVVPTLEPIRTLAGKSVKKNENIPIVEPVADHAGKPTENIVKNSSVEAVTEPVEPIQKSVIKAVTTQVEESSIKPSEEPAVVHAVKSTRKQLPNIEAATEVIKEPTVKPSVESIVKPSVRSSVEFTEKASVESTVKPSVETTVKPLLESKVKSSVKSTEEPPSVKQIVEPEGEFVKPAVDANSLEPVTELYNESVVELAELILKDVINPSTEPKGDQSLKSIPAPQTISTATEKKWKTSDLEPLRKFPSLKTTYDLPIIRDDKNICTFCLKPIKSNVKIIVSEPKLYCHQECFKCGDCSAPLGDLLTAMFLHQELIKCERCFRTTL